MRAFLDAHEGRLASCVIPAAGFLLERGTTAKGFDLAGNLEGESAADAGDGVEIFHLDLGAVFFGADGTDRDIDIATKLAFLHVGVAGASVNHDLLQHGEVGKGLFGRGNIGFADDFEQWGAGTVEIDAGGGLHVEALGDILLDMDADETDIFVLCGDAFLGVLRIREIMERNTAAEAEGQIVLADLVVLRHVGVEIVFAVELADRSDLAAQHEACERGELESLFVHDRQGTGHAEADRADIGIRLGAVFDRAGAKHLAAGFELNVNFEADGGDVICHGVVFGEVGFCLGGMA